MDSASKNEHDRAAGDVAAMQFAGGRSVAELAEEWERDAAWVEAAIRRALLEAIPRSAGGLKATRAEARAARQATLYAAEDSQQELNL